MLAAQSQTRLFPTALMAMALMACAGTSGDAANAVQPIAWDQAAVTAIAKNLPRATGLLYQAIYDEGQMNQAPASLGISANASEFLSDARLMEEESGHLAADLAKGKGKDETIGSFQRLKELSDDAQVSANQAFEVEQIDNHFHQVRSLISRLEPYYVQPN